MSGYPSGETGLATEELEIELLLEALFQRYGFDYRDYDRQAIRRRLYALMRARGLATVSRLQDRVLHEPGASDALLRALAVPPATLFDDPEQARQLRIVLASCLRASAVPKIWLAECGGAEEAWSLAIMLAEEQLHTRTDIYATAANEQMLDEARNARISLERMEQCKENYRASGGTGNLDDYFEIEDGHAVLASSLRNRINWAQYNLVTDASFNEFQLIVCRRALPDFGPVLRRRVLRLFHESLARFGVLGIDREFDEGDAFGENYQAVFSHQGWYKRVA
nr:CheR family methyltransferase [Massilia soli]